MFVAGTSGQMFQNLGACLCDGAALFKSYGASPATPSYLLGKKTTLAK